MKRPDRYNDDVPALEAENKRLRSGISKFLDGRMTQFNDSRAVDDDLVELAKVLLGAKANDG